MYSQARAIKNVPWCVISSLGGGVCVGGGFSRVYSAASPQVVTQFYTLDPEHDLLLNYNLLSPAN